MLILVVAVSMTMGASATSYIPDDVTYQNLNGQQLAIKTYTLLPDQDPSDLYEDDFEYDGFLYSMSDIVKEEQRYQEENAHTEVVTVTTASKNLEDILAELKPTIEYDDGVSSGTLSLDHSTLKTEAAGYKRSSYTVTATKNYTGLDRNDSSYSRSSSPINRGEQQATACCSQIIRFSCDVRDTRMSSIGTSNNAPRAYRLSTEGRLFPCCHL